MTKSALYTSGVSEDVQELIVKKLGMPLETLPFKYLGVPLSHRKLTIA